VLGHPPTLQPKGRCEQASTGRDLPTFLANLGRTSSTCPKSRFAEPRITRELRHHAGCMDRSHSDGGASVEPGTFIQSEWRYRFFALFEMWVLKIWKATTLLPQTKLVQNVLNAWIHGDLVTVNMLGMAHAEFSSMFQRRESAQRFAENQIVKTRANPAIPRHCCEPFPRRRGFHRC
jgi:hypothetical protein